MDEEMSLMSRLQNCIAPSSIEAEYMTIAEAGKEMIWMTDYQEKLDKNQHKKILYTDSQNTI